MWHAVRKGRQSILVGLGLGLGLSLSLVVPVAASSVAQGFRAGGSGIVAGALVSLDSGSADSVELSSLTNRVRLVGVVGKQSLVEFVNGKPIQVVTTGTTSVLVSDLNGTIKAGDKVTASPISGIGMRATESVMVAGTAQADMDTAKAETRQIAGKNGQEKTVHIGAVPLLVGPAFYQAAGERNRLVPSAFQSLANGVAGHAVSPVRVMVAGLVIVLFFVAVAVLLYSTVRASFVAIGRNPLSRQAVQKSLFEVGVTTFGVLAFTVIIVYLILTT
jgi:hypothetical protein